MPELQEESYIEPVEEISITSTTRLYIVEHYLYIENACCGIEWYASMRIFVPADFLYNELQRVLHPEEYFPLNADHPNYPVESILTSFRCRVTNENLSSAIQATKSQLKPIEYEAKSKLYFGYHETKRGSYYYLADYNFAREMTGNDMIIRIGKSQMEMVLQFLQRHLYKFNYADTNSGR
jgi:hypothetical protein